MKLIDKIKAELVMSVYLTGWEILHYKNLLEKLTRENGEAI